MLKTVVAVFTVDTGDGESWSGQDIAISLEVRQGFQDATVWDSIEDFMRDTQPAARDPIKQS